MCLLRGVVGWGGDRKAILGPASSPPPPTHEKTSCGVAKFNNDLESVNDMSKSTFSYEHFLMRNIDSALLYLPKLDLVESVARNSRYLCCRGAGWRRSGGGREEK